MDVFHSRVEFNIFLSDANRYIIQVIGKDFGTKKELAMKGRLILSHI